MIIVKCVEKVRDKNNIITDYVLEDCNGMRQTLSSDQVKSMIKHEWLNILNLKLTSDGKLIDNQDYNTEDIELNNMAAYRNMFFEDVRILRSWDGNYKILCRAINNGVKVQQKTVYEGVNIGIWLNNQRQLFKKGNLSEDRVHKLEEIGLELDIRRIIPWDETYKTLCRAINNGVKVTQTTVYEDVNIGVWIHTQRQLFKNGKLTKDKIKKLQDIGLELDIRRKVSWDENYETLCRAINNGVKVQQKTVYEGINIGIWLNNQRQLFKKGNLSEDRVHKLEEIGLEFDPRKESWNETYKTLCKAINNGVKITQTTVYEGVNIGIWIHTQRQLFKNGKLSEDKIQKFKDIGLELDPGKASWDENYKTLCKAINNGVKITTQTVYEGVNIGIWLNNQRQLFKKGKLPEDRIEKLRKIGVIK